MKLGRSLLAAAAFVMLLSISLAGCALKDDTNNGVDVYYINSSDDGLVSENCGLNGETESEKAEQVLDLPAQYPGTKGLKAPISVFSVLSASFYRNCETVDLSEEYRSLDRVTEILTRAAIVKSLCNIEGIDKVVFTVNGEALTDSDGRLIGVMNGNTFIFNTGKEIASNRKVQLHLYFADETGTALVDTYRKVVYNTNFSIERLVVDQVLKGTSSGFAYPTLNPLTKVNSVSTSDGVCYLDLNEQFLTNPYSVSAETALFSLVNSLTELPGVHKVQISIDGDPNCMFMETIPLKNAFEQNLSLTVDAESTEQ